MALSEYVNINMVKGQDAHNLRSHSSEKNNTIESKSECGQGLTVGEYCQGVYGNYLYYQCNFL